MTSTAKAAPGKQLVLNSEDQARFDALRAHLCDLHDMSTDEERELVDRYVEARWRLDRCRRAETALFDQVIAEVQSDNPALDPDQAMAYLFTDERHARKLRLFLRYQAAIERAFHQADKAFNDYLLAREELQAPALFGTGAPRPKALPRQPLDGGFVSHTQGNQRSAPGAAQDR